MSEHMALENLTVLDLTRVLAGPFCTMMLADMGANVIKIEVPKGGDDTRSYPPFRAKNLNGERESVYFANINRNKKGITLNLKAPEGKEIFKELVKKADIVVENYRPGVMDKLGLGYDVLKEINPRIIYAAVSGFGCYGPYHLRPLLKQTVHPGSCAPDNDIPTTLLQADPDTGTTEAGVGISSFCPLCHILSFVNFSPYKKEKRSFWIILSYYL